MFFWSRHLFSARVYPNYTAVHQPCGWFLRLFAVHAAVRPGGGGYLAHHGAATLDPHVEVRMSHSPSFWACSARGIFTAQTATQPHTRTYGHGHRQTPITGDVREGKEGPVECFPNRRSEGALNAPPPRCIMALRQSSGSNSSSSVQCVALRHCSLRRWNIICHA